jgi:putative transposase
MRAEGKSVTTTQLCRWFGVPRRTLYYRSKPRRIPLDEAKVARVKAVIEEQPTFG